MFHVREIQPTDLPQVYEFTLSLLRHHPKQCTSYLDSNGLADLFLEGYLRGLLLVKVEDAPVPTGCLDVGMDGKIQRPIGCMIFHPDFSPLHGGRGVYLDQFYIEPPFRRIGLGRKMMIELCHYVLASNGTYIKLTYQNGLGLDPVYENMGFINLSRQYPGLHLFESYGKLRLESFFERGRELANQPIHTSHRPIHRLILTVPLSYPVSEDECGIPAWHPISTRLPPRPNFTSFGPPPARLVIVKEETPPNSHSSSTTPPDCLTSIGTKFCMFVEQCSVCSWLGPMVTFSDFVGDTTVLDSELFTHRVRSWTELSDKISGAVWEVSVGPIPNTSELEAQPCSFNHAPLASILSSLNVPDDTSQEGWNIAFLDATGIRNLIESQTRNDEQKRRLD